MTRPSFLAAHPASESNKKGLALGRLRCKVLQGVGSPVQCRVCSLTATHSSSDQNIAVLHMNFDCPFSPALVRLEPVQPPVEPAILPFDKNTEHKSSAPQIGDRFCLLEPSADWPALLRIHPISLRTDSSSHIASLFHVASPKPAVSLLFCALLSLTRKCALPLLFSAAASFRG